VKKILLNYTKNYTKKLIWPAYDYQQETVHEPEVRKIDVVEFSVNKGSNDPDLDWFMLRNMAFHK